MWEAMFESGIPYAEKAVRTVLVYLSIVVLLRLAGKRELAQVNTFDLVVMLLLSNVVQNAVIGPDTSVSGAVFGAAVLAGSNALLVRAVARYPRLNKLFESAPLTLARGGRYDMSAVRRVGLRLPDLAVAIRKQGGDHVSETSSVTLEPGGTLLVRLTEDDQSADKADIKELRAALKRLERRLDDTAR
ncbi:DUF421 domain-containing protein [Streptomyces iconiensis]|uniref:DUF421 domain-containing protein n=1 Tax=Streptomyces iconiensis TaxID=1384038 RepID=A0ABT6ZQR0_9ACTN|nr:YetF domain-containing protein [Streptomyces iconiensis]MDJ1131021.1 DUF421 domain-containing protein [Streptomyces iconiensis]